jgi:hypothetical protein
MRKFKEADGWRYTASVTNTATGQLQWLEARHRAHARAEDCIRCAKDTGLRRLPSREFAINQACCTAAAIATDLTAWLQLLALRGDLGTAEPKRLRYRILHTAARLVHGQRRRRLRIPTIWPWAQQITTAYTRIMTIPRTRLTSTTVNRDKRRTPVGTRRSGWPVASGRTSPTAGARHTR